MSTNKTDTGNRGDARVAYEKWEIFYGLVVGLAGFVCLGLIFIDSAYFAAFVVIAAAAGLARYAVRKKLALWRRLMRHLRVTHGGRNA